MSNTESVDRSGAFGLLSHSCADCGARIGNDAGPPDGWQLEGGRIVCHSCCVADTRRQLAVAEQRTLYAAGSEARDAWCAFVLALAYSLRIDRVCDFLARVLRRFTG